MLSHDDETMSASDSEASSSADESNGRGENTKSLWALFRTGIDYDDLSPADWGAVQRRIASHPHEVAQPLGRTCAAGGRNFALVLHDLCRRMYSNDIDQIPLDVFRSAIAAYPEALRTRTCDCGRCEENYLPLHLACMDTGLGGRSTDGAIEVFDAYPAAASSPSPDSLPLYMYVTRSTAPDPRLVRRLLRAHPEGARKEELVECVLAKVALKWSSISTLSGYTYTNGDCKSTIAEKCFQSALEIIRTRSQLDLKSSSSASEFFPLHAALHAESLSGFSYHIDVLKDFISRLKDEFARKDSNGNLPIHVLLRSVPQESWESNETPLFLEIKDQAARHMVNMFSPSVLAQISPTPDSLGTLPLHLAVRNGHCLFEHGRFGPLQSVTQLLVDAAPKAVETRDVTTHLCPFMMAAVDTSTCDLNTVYKLLRMSPMMARGLANCDRAVDGKERMLVARSRD